MTANSLDQPPSGNAETPTRSVGRTAMQIVGFLAIFTAAYFASSTLLTDGYSTATTAARLAVGAVSALIAVGALRWSRRPD